MSETIDTSDDRPGQLSHAAVRPQLEKVLSSPTFAQAPMLRRLLQYLAEHTLEGRERQLKEYAIGVDVFRRGEAFDPRTDTIVRVQARRLRLKVAEYYAGEGQHDPIVIQLQKGRYGVRWRLARPAEAVPDRPAETRLPSIVVLPFANLTGNGDDEYLSDGLTEEIISTLASLPALRVVARTSAFQFKGRSDDIRKIGRELGVQTALEGSVRKDGQRIPVTAQLINVADGFHLWSHIYEGELPGVFALQETTTRAIVDALRLRLTAGERERLRPQQPVSVDAYELYLKGLFFLNKAAAADLETSVHYMERAVAVDPTYAAAHAGIAMACLAWATQGDHPAPDLAERARQAATRAIEVGDVAEAHAAIGSVLAMADWDWINAEREFKRALELNPSFAIARMMYANVWLCALRRYGEAIGEMRQVRTLDPVSPLVRTIYGQTLALAGRHADAVDELRQALELAPDFNFARFTLAFAYLGAGSYGEAIDALRPMRHLAAQVPNCAGHLGYAHACLGNRAEAEALLQALLDHFQGAWAPWIDIAAIHNGLGHTTQALDWLERGYRNRCFDALFIRDDPRFANLRSHSRFDGLARQLAIVCAPGTVT